MRNCEQNFIIRNRRTIVSGFEKQIRDDLYMYILAFGEYNFKQVNVSGIQIFCAQLLGLNLRKVMFNAANVIIPI